MGGAQPGGDLTVQLLRCRTGGRSVLVESESTVDEVQLDGEPEALVTDQVFHFSPELARLGQGVTGVALVN